MSPVSRTMFSALILFAAPFVIATSINTRHNDHHDVSTQLPSTWYHAAEHPVHKLFKRGPEEDTDGIEYATVGSPTWASSFPQSTPDVAQLPQAWTDALRKAVADGKIPNIPPTRAPSVDVAPAYPPGVDPMDPNICSATYRCRIPGDMWDAPDGVFGTGFDDTPTQPSIKLNQFLKDNNERTTHFMIGVNIRQNPDIFLDIFNHGSDIAVHTYTHPAMTALSNEEVLGQLGWTMEIIHNSTGGRLPRYWRPPYGDYDLRVRAIAREVFGLEVILWNHDTMDWSLITGGTTPAAINASLTQWLTGPKSPGLIILEHDTSEAAVDAFISAYPVIKANGWQLVSQAQLSNGHGSTYQNVDAQGEVTFKAVAADVVVPSSPNPQPAPASPGTNSSPSSSASSSPSSAGSSTSVAGNLPTGSTNAESNNGSPSSVSHPLAFVLCSPLLLFASLLT
ncbi:glycoside hydrolase/deacetylase [Pleurotus eryngii]|uniref:chitin deacetylase n=1 Tax=Pleurotus eryngii TaxID=5323 RepID=A0A9P5ZP67_PLEER|nr:glycoside hydrolase/deacetylase [Pleurotus eryngii]